MKTKNSYILDLRNTGRTTLAMVGGKGANLSALSGIENLHVPGGFCVTTEVYKEMISSSAALDAMLDQLASLEPGDRKNLKITSAKIRELIEEIEIPKRIGQDITRHLAQLGEDGAYAVRSSATAEDLPTASFAGQQDTYLNIKGNNEIIKHISLCWASLFTERAVSYRMQNGLDHKKVYMAVVIQKMIFPDAAGIMFTADPVTANRKVVSIDASFGLGEALVSGLVNADNYKVRGDMIIGKQISTKKMAIYPLNQGGTKQQPIDTGQQTVQTLTDPQILQLARIGKEIEEHFGSPQDIEWCWAHNTFYIVQSRPITTLHPVPEANDQENHVYLSVGHQQMMTDAMKQLGLSFWLLTTPAFMRTAGGRLFVDVTSMLASPANRNTIIDTLGKFDPLIKDALTTIIRRGDFIKSVPEDIKVSGAQKSNVAPLPDYNALIEYDPFLVTDLMLRSQTSLVALKQNIQTKSGSDLFNFIQEDIKQLKKTLSDPQSFAVIMTGMNAATWINEKMSEWLGEKNPADTIAQSAPNNITSEMGLALLDVADVIRPYPQVIAYLQQVREDNFLEELLQFEGGHQSRGVIISFLNKYGMRCSGEIDITKTRWSEKPLTLVPIILSHIKNFDPGESKRKFELGQAESMKKEKELLEQLRTLPDGEQKVKETKRMIDLVRNFAGYREYPKYNMVNHYFIYKQALLKEAERLFHAKIIQDREDIYYLSFEELQEVVRTGKLDYSIITQRKYQYTAFEKLAPPRVITSDGEIITGRYNLENIPAGAMPGLAVSAGVIEGRARVLLNMDDADLAEGDILVTSFTDPSWTPLFVSVKGLVTEVGGLMTHGAVIAREYGLPAVVGVENATKLIKDKQRIRVHGTHGYVEIL